MRERVSVRENKRGRARRKGYEEDLADLMESDDLDSPGGKCKSGLGQHNKNILNYILRIFDANRPVGTLVL